MITITTDCVDCGESFTYTKRHNNVKQKLSRCPSCLKKRGAWYTRESRKRLHPELQHGVGSGNAQGVGAGHHSFKTGINARCFRRIAFKAHGKVCSGCGVKLNLCVHHRDRNRHNNDASNLQVVCKRCHQMVCHADLRMRDAEGKWIAEHAEVKSGKKSGNPSNGQSDQKFRRKDRNMGND